MEKVIITAAITGAATVPSLTPYLPLTPEQIAESAIDAVKAGAAIVHIHARHPDDGSPSARPEHFRPILARIKAATDAVICITTGGSPTMTVQERAANVPEFKPEMCSFNLGSMNFALHTALKRHSQWKYPWEPKYLEMSKDFVFKNTFLDFEHLCRVTRENGVKPELEVYDVGHLYNLAFLVQERLIEPPLHLQFVMGVLGGIGTMPEDLTFLKHKADLLFGPKQFTWSVVGVGVAQFHLGAISLQMGGHIRVGLEDNIYIRKGVLAKSNAELVERAVRLASEFDREPATPDEARRILGLKGKEKVNF